MEPLGVVPLGVGPLGVGVAEGVGPLGEGPLGVGVTDGEGPLGRLRKQILRRKISKNVIPQPRKAEDGYRCCKTNRK